MTLRKLFVIGAALAALGVAAAAAAPMPAFAVSQSASQKALIDAAKAQGSVGEQADGYVGFRQGGADAALQEAVRVTNAARRQAYEASGRQAGTSGAVAGSRMFESQLLPRMPAGQWYRDASGSWTRK